MKNLFKKSSKKETATIQKIDKKQLEKIIGGADTLSIDSTESTARITFKAKEGATLA